MKEFKDDLTILSPVKDYTPPQLPTLQETRKNPVLIKKNLPLRWRTNAKVITCIGLIGAGLLTLTGCSGEDLRPGCTHHGGGAPMPIYVDRDTEQDILGFNPTQVIINDLELMAHYGGAASGPFYVVYLTEQEAMSIIRSQLEIAGLRFSDITPDITVEVNVDPYDTHFVNFGLDLYDADKGVAIVHIGQRGRHLADAIAEEFEQQRNDFSVGVFFTPGLSPDV